MQAAVIYPQGGMPEYTTCPEPQAQGEDQVLVAVKAVSLKHFDKGRATGQHYSSSAPREGGRIPGGDGVCLLPDGRRVYGMGTTGMLAEKAVIEKDRIVPVPDNLDDAIAAALPNAVIGAAMALRFKADIQPGDVVLVNGATGFTGRVAVQLARHYGAGKVIATGRNVASLEELKSLGADDTVSLLQDDEALLTQFKQLQPDVVIDYLWGHSAELILASLKGQGGFTPHVRFVSVGAMAGDIIQLSAANLRSVNLQLTGSGLGAWTRGQVKQLFSTLLPEAFALAAAGALQVKTTTVPLENISTLWNQDVSNGERLVVLI
ncbi:alcohol dehydrogenase [Chitinophaga parva]|uniref:Alcohol dehydrogenase n=1 Tax=Chitinophaga parva TaxID=2169414 RepID=A0A2T7BCG1_9BACT|nr:zinc-binding alcohol dehydrogenase family protein [Chitinophaga parva]PUZ22788.1 alcohol dehydrogenase [Chitinophaga parva]